MGDPRPTLTGLWDRLEARGAVVHRLGRIDLAIATDRWVRCQIEWCEKRLRCLHEGDASGVWTPPTERVTTP